MSGGRVPILASCSNCGAIFPSAVGSMFPGGNVQRLKLEGNTETCRYCGGEARVIDGVFDLTGGVITAVSAPHVTKAMLAAFEAAVRRAYQQRKPAEDLAKEVEKIDPSFGTVIRKNSDPSIYLALLVLILFAIRSCSANIEMKVDVNQLIQQWANTPPAVILAPEPPSMEPRPDQPPP